MRFKFVKVAAAVFSAVVAHCSVAVHAAAPNKSRPLASLPKPAGTNYSKRTEVQAFMADMVARHGFVESELAFLFSRARFYPAIVELITPPANPRVRSWQVYRSRFLEPIRIDGGVALWKRYESELARAEKEFGVPAEIIVAIMGVETVYGKNTGSWRVIDARSVFTSRSSTR